MTAELGQGKLPPTTLSGLVEKNYNEQFTACLSKEANKIVAPYLSYSSLGSLNRQMLLLGVTKIQNKIVAPAARIRFTGGFEPVISRKAHCSCICSARREKIFILSQTD